ncbi:hypothetical protein [Rossellomorea aquimaris]|uniref:Uncharacterized protein n=1 Tax=Rossellomorea aquimaris TaxID=189382 RepID=A0A5D4U341_9BACI|nr:hypothetical protein [Rossellomorea aquimaris]TYS81754.1 hypothetical protein FZD05_02795 [Rossellomorea aquimaris]TYS88378.1 hypothetical protein FZC85_02795 [Rossellomorea aquimaris]
MTNKLNEFIIKGHFEKAKEMTNELSYSELDGKLMETAFKDSSITNYAFIMSLLVEEEHVALHEMAFRLMVVPLSYLDGAYYAALYHARRCVELTDRQDIRYLSNLLFLHQIPDKVVSEEEAYDTAKRMLALDPDHVLAKEFLNK